MGFIKKHLFWLLCGLVALVGIGIFVPGYLLNKKNAEQIKSLESSVDKVGRLRSTAAQVNTTILEQFDRFAEQAQEDVSMVKELARRTTDRPLLYPDIFPSFRDLTEKAFDIRQFGQRYTQAAENYPVRLGGGEKPSAIEERKVIEKYEERATGEASNRRTNLFGNAPTTRVTSRSDSPEEKLVADLRRQRADEIAVYVSPDSFCCYRYWLDPGIGDADAMLIEAWFTQVAHWIQEDVIESILQVNGDSTMVANSAVKRLLEVAFAGDPPLLLASNTTGGQGSEGAAAGPRIAGRNTQLPTYVVKGEEDVVQGQLTYPVTEHFTDDLVDVVHFDVGVVIDSVYLMDFINALQSEKVTEVTEANGTVVPYKRNQITVLRIDIEPLDVQEENMVGYYYGNGSMQVARLICEYVFFKLPEIGLYEQWKPQPVKDLLSGEEEYDDR